MGVGGIIGDSSNQVADTIKEYKENDGSYYLTTCPGYPKLTEDESEYIQYEAE